MRQHNLLGPHSGESDGPPRTHKSEFAGINCLGWKDASCIKLFNRYLGWRDACINRFDRGSMRLISIVVNFCVVRVIEFLRNAKLFQSFLAS